MSEIITREQFSSWFHSFQRSAFRLEQLDQYAVASEASEFARFLAGEALPLMESEWIKLVRERVNAGASMRRVHAVSLPLTSYVKYELQWGYLHSSMAGEDIFLANRASLPPQLASLPDFWLFDQDILILMRYDSAGRFLQPEQESSPEVVNRYRELSASLICAATPLKEFLARARSCELVQESKLFE